MCGLTPLSFSGHQLPSSTPFEPQQTHMGYQQRRTEMIRSQQGDQAMVTIQDGHGGPSFYPSSYLEVVDTGPRYASAIPQFSLTGKSATQESVGMLQNFMPPISSPMTLPYNGEMRAFMPTHVRRESPWTDRHTDVLRQGKRAGKSVPDIVKDLYQIDGVERTANMVSKKWGKIRGSCIKRHVSTYHILFTLFPCPRPFLQRASIADTSFPFCRR